MKCEKPNLSILWVVTVGTKWQIVIPKEIRDKLGIFPGKKFITLLKDDKYLGLVDHENMDDLKKYIDTV
jgi:AbrB family looped-hinge helix DNA binding protein